MLLLAEQYLNTGRTDGGTSQILDRLRNTRPEEIASCLIHGDCTTDNILFEGTTLKTFIDFPYPKINPAFHGKPSKVSQRSSTRPNRKVRCDCR